MREVWLHPNRRALAIGFVIAAIPLGLALGVGFVPNLSPPVKWTLIGLAVSCSAVTAIVCAALWRRPRLAFEGGDLLVYLEGLEPARLPIDVVECFFPGQGSGMVRSAQGGDSEVRTIIVRLAEAAKDWHHRDVEASLGHWCEGYITIRGTWCEPITPELLRRLNQRLAEIHRERKAEAARNSS